MKIYLTILYSVLFAIGILAEPLPTGGKVLSYEKQQNSVIFSLENGKLKLQFFTESIVRVVYSPKNDFSQRKSLSVLESDWATVKFDISNDGAFYTIKTSKVTAKVAKLTATVSFLDATGNPILQEKEDGRTIEKTQLAGDTAFVVRQNWNSSANEAIYGVGQYQYDIINWHNVYMRMQQKNTAIAMPVIVSSKGYGLFWDNYSQTEFNPDLKPIVLNSTDNNNLNSKLIADQTGEYTFALNKEEWNPIEVYCNDSLVYAHYAGVSYPYRVFKIKLQAGKSYDFHVKNIDRPINPTISSEYLRPKDGKPGETGLKAEYFDNVDLKGEPAFIRIDKVIDFDWGTGAPKDGFKTDLFSIRWSGKIIGSKNMKGATIDLTTDDGVRLFINGKKVVESWIERGPITDSYKLDLEEGKEYDVVIEYFESGGGASARLSWSAEEPKGKAEFANKVKMFYRSPEMGKMLSFKSQVADQIDYYFIYGENADKIIDGLRTITGKAPLYPKWAYGLFMSQYGWKDQQTIQGLIDGYRDRKIPVDVIVQDMDYWQLEPKNLWGSDLFDLNRYPNPQGMVDYLHRKNAHTIISVWPRINQGTDVYDDMNAKNYLLAVQQTQGNAAEGIVIKDDSPNAAYDPFNKNARDMYWSYMNKRLFSKGFDGWWMDASEPEWGYDFSRAYTAMGSGNRYLNAYPLMAKKGVYEGQLSTNSTKRPYILTRSSFVGQQRFATTTWSGDIGPDWTTFRKVIPAGLNYCLTGMPYWTNDIGGFAVYDFVQSPKYPELLVRWFEYGTFLPIFRVHGCRKTPFWNYDEATQNILRQYTNLRYRLMPFIYSMGAMVTNENFTIDRALVMDFGSDANVLNIQDQFMFGNEIMVCPVTYPSLTNRKVYLPVTIGGWFDFWTGSKLKEGTTIMANAPLEKMPLFVKAGSIIPMGPYMQYATESKADTIEVRVYTGANGSFNLYEDEGDNFNYQKGQFSMISFHWDDKSQTLTIGDRKGNFEGMLIKRVFNVVIVNETNGIGIDTSKKPTQTLNYSGKNLKIKIK